ncbi:CBS domain-containing protein [Azospirillum sp. YIM DDC1]|uniref:CBS domain-containing protein n=1 Tax=Azospirillum aestuarii TaxID=2802052 RepID=A0ABS1I5Y9_9PROT|nr:CBS domain-containing protein [Azospirillum aestuarii]MBK3775768.1 CBS domain-containing protein [Azospirillum brasilense]MBK4722480.1 CBS domain-containing protein [Azospirillum aestuarii]TWA90005.1 CBS domain-containing protein [Azospirillum brasilense]
MRVEDILRRKGTRIGTVRINETVETALRLLKAENTGALVVKDVCRTEGNTVVGVISERDIVRGLTDRGPGILSLPVTSVMSNHPVCCTPGDSVRHVLQLMDEHTVRHIPVLDGASLVGVVSVRDLIKAQLDAAPPDAEPGEIVNYPVAAAQ